MKKTVVIHQPDLLPYLGFFHRFLYADLYVALDHVQFVHSNRGWTHRDKIKTPSGPQWITVAVKKAPRDTPISAIELADTDWRERNLALLRENYRAAPFFDEIYAHVERLYGLPATMLVDFTLTSIRMLMKLLDAEVPVIMSSSLNPAGAKTDLLVDIMKKVNGTEYLSGVGARDYLDVQRFEAERFQVLWQEFPHPSYPQLHGEMLPYLSSIDVLFNRGVQESRRILRESSAEGYVVSNTRGPEAVVTPSAASVPPAPDSNTR